MDHLWGVGRIAALRWVGYWIIEPLDHWVGANIRDSRVGNGDGASSRECKSAVSKMERHSRAIW